MIDKIKLALAAAVLIAGIVAYYQLPSWMGPDVSILLRVGIALVSIVVALGIAATSQYGMALIDFSKGSHVELRKMVWPTRPETIQTTSIVLVIVVLIGLMLWFFDAIIFQVIYDWLLGIDD